MKITTEHYESFMAALNHYNDIVNANRVELNPPEVDEYLPPDTPENEGTQETGGNLNLDLL